MCLACGVEKDTRAKEFYTVDDRLVQDEPIDPLLALCCEGWEGDKGWRTVVVCHACFARLDPDMWISSRCWANLTPVIPFERLPAHDHMHGGLGEHESSGDCGLDSVEGALREFLGVEQ